MGVRGGGVDGGVGGGSAGGDERGGTAGGSVSTHVAPEVMSLKSRAWRSSSLTRTTFSA